MVYEAFLSEETEITLVLRDASDNPMTGVVAADMTVYLRKDSDVFQEKVVTETNFLELDPVNAPGYYVLILEPSETDTEGHLAVHVQANGGIGLARQDLLVAVRERPAVRRHLVSGTGREDAPSDLGLWDVLGDGTATLLEISKAAIKAAGLSQENFRITDQVYDTQNNLTSAVVRFYASKSDTENQVNAVAEYELTAAYADELLTDYRLVQTAAAVTAGSSMLSASATLDAIGEIN